MGSKICNVPKRCHCAKIGESKNHPVEISVKKSKLFAKGFPTWKLVLCSKSLHGNYFYHTFTVWFCAVEIGSVQRFALL